MEEYEFDLAVSFAGEDRFLVNTIVQEITRENKIRVFYDELEKSTLLGKDLYQYLSEIYTNKAKYCLIFISENYKKKQWTNLELKSAQARAFRQDSEYILPIKLDDTQLPGLQETVGYIDARQHSIVEIINILFEKLGLNIERDEQDTLLFWKIRSVINSSDPLSLLGNFIGAPSDEYDPETVEIVELLSKVKSPEELVQEIWRIFVKYFGEGIAGEIDDYERIGHEIWALVNENTLGKLYNYGGYKPLK
ncbi:TIR domain-containing protein [Bacillus megaterium]|uniref:toll/interleukin-1 receptor domain-containing protein n=1 Tax=Priestia megaterium TaxID=1404 RepID=UPI001293E3B5|nr:TIR domain-containing protein [Priestia megaterium]MQR84844.1 TIR domain-containing protein [Priestia megaterium]